MPNHSLLSEVTVESRGEGSSSEEEDEFGQEPEQEGHDIETSQPSLDNVDLDAIMRGPTPIKLRNLISIMESKEVGFDTEDEDDDMGPLEVEDDGAEERKYRRLSQHLAESSDEKEDVEDGGGDDDSKKRSMLPPKISARPNGSTSNAKDPVGSRTDVIPTSDSDDMRVSFSGAPDSTKALPEGNGKAAEALDLDKPSDTSPIGGTSLLCNKTEANNDPIEPADDLVESMHGRAFDIDPIEATTPPGLKATIPLSPVIHSTPKSGVVKRMKNRHGQHPNPSQIPVRADDPEMTRRAKVATGTGSDQLSIRGGTGRTRADLPHVSSQPVGRGATFAKMNGNAATPFHSQPLPKIPTSLAKWDVIRESSPSVMTDEIDRSSPLLDGPVEILGELAGQASDQNDVGERSDDGSADKSRKPLFELTESLVPFPDSQGNSPLQNHLDVPASQVPFPYSKYNAPIQKRFEVVEDSEFETDGGEKEKKTVAKGRRSIAPYRKLSDIAASQSALFSQSTPVVPRPSTLTSRKVWQADDADDETSSSDSDGGSQSHIPEAMRAGRLRSKKLKGLLGLNY
ncbi:hypothetical protein K503DRAFT_543459 [Rhizopogon vinicolor AM-OR11-026]|uniref:Uncharacterized protein n=1 Tax=Rhizopogon vinicolor AM-OR11-026 TaxID=1314800 RepID=A0A1B7NGZ9_9AGAM|nr:hypothetical protein K503DRAFT_543459 [Rhizopogon vinicolor AM-OR11-026]